MKASEQQLVVVLFIILLFVPRNQLQMPLRCFFFPETCPLSEPIIEGRSLGASY